MSELLVSQDGETATTLPQTAEEKARQILKDFGLGATTSMDEAVRMVIEKAQEVGA